MVKLNPVEQISNILSANGYGENLVCGHIKYDEKVNDSYDYQIIRTSSHDGTLMFTQRLIDQALLPVINKQTYGKNTINEDQLDNVIDINYTIGDIFLESEYGVQVKNFTGMRDTVTLPIKVEYVFN
jgi:hypothetical protein